MDERGKQKRTFDEDGFRKRASCLCFRDVTESELLLVTSSRDKEKWIVPGGGIEPNEDPCIAASREVLEEAGARGVMGRLIGVVKDENKKTRTSVFTFIVKELSDEWDDGILLGRKRSWFSIHEAKEKLKYNSVQLYYLNLLAGCSLTTDPSFLDKLFGNKKNTDDYLFESRADLRTQNIQFTF